MIQTNENLESVPKRKRKYLRRGIWFLGIFTVLLFAAGGWLFGTSTGQTRLVLWVVDYLLPVELELSRFQLTTRKAVFDELKLYPSKGKESLPMLEAGQLDMSFTPRPGSARYVNDISLGTLTVRYIEEADGSTNWDDLQNAFRSDPSLPDSTSPSMGILPWLPENVQLASLTFDGEAPDWRLALSPLTVAAAIQSTEAFDIKVFGDELHAEWALPVLGLEQSEVSGGLDMHLVRANDSWFLDVQSDLPTLAEGNVWIQIENSPSDDDSRIFSLEMPSMSLAAPVLLPVISPRLPFPVQYASLSMNDTILSGKWVQGNVDIGAAQFHLSVENLLFGPMENPWYHGDLNVNVEGGAVWSDENLFSESHLDWEVILNHHAPVTLATEGSLTEAIVRLQVSDWDKGVLQEVLPAQYADYLRYFPGFNGFETLEMNGEWHAPGLLLQGVMLPRLVGSSVNWSNNTVHLNGQLNADLEGDADWFEGTIGIQSNHGVMDAMATLRRDLHLLTDITLNDFNPAPWVTDWLGQPWPDNLSVAISGTAGYQYAPGAGALQQLDINVRFMKFDVGDITLASQLPVQIEGRAAFNGDTPLHGDRLQMRQSEVFEASWERWRTQYDPFSFSGQLNATANLPAVASLMDINGIWGDIQLSGPVSVGSQGFTSTSLELRSEDLMWGDWGVPYGQELVLHGALEMDWSDTPQLRMMNPDVRVGQSEAKADGISLFFAHGDAPIQVRLDNLVLNTDLSPLVTQGWLRSGSGELHISAPELMYAEDSLRGRFAIAIDAERMVLPESIAALDDVQFNGALAYDGAMTGSGKLHLDHLSVGGILVGTTDSEVRFEGVHVIIEDIVANLLGGMLEGVAVIGLLDSTRPVEIQGEVQNLDLERFTEEFKPPDVFLTGLVNGTFSVAFNESGIDDLKANLEATEHFSLNRDMVEYLLLSEYVGDISGGRNLERVVRRTVGDAPQRVFDRAVLDLGFEAGRITGIARLESRTLNLTFDIVADPEALLEALKIRQQDAMHY